MPRVKLNPRSVGSLKPRPGRDRDTWWDDTEGAPTGFGVRVTADGSRSYVVTYRAHGRFRWLTLGKVEALGLSEARDLARKALLRVASGEDPAAEKTERRRGDTLAALVEQYVDHGADERAEKTTADYGRQARVLARSTLGKTPAPAIARADVRQYVEGLAEDAPTYANRMLTLIRAACRWAVGRDLLPADPTTGIEKPGSEDPNRARLGDDEVRQLWLALDAPANEAPSPEVAACVKTLLLLGTRKRETCRMRWADLDLEAATWTVPPSDRKGGRALVVPLPPAVVKILTALRGRTGKHEYVFSGRRGAPLSSNPDRWTKTVRKVCGIDFAPHALRRTFARGLARLGVSSEMISRLLGHKVAAGTLAVTEGYSEYDFLAERAAALNAWAAHVEKIVSGQERKADVLPMRRA
jgi:integrase